MPLPKPSPAPASPSTGSPSARFRGAASRTSYSNDSVFPRTTSSRPCGCSRSQKYEVRSTKSEVGKRLDFRLQTSDFRLQTCGPSASASWTAFLHPLLARRLQRLRLGLLFRRQQLEHLGV